MYANWCQTFHRHTLLSAIMSKKRLSTKILPRGCMVGAEWVRGLFKIHLLEYLDGICHIPPLCEDSCNQSSESLWPYSQCKSLTSGQQPARPGVDPTSRLHWPDSPSWDSLTCHWNVAQCRRKNRKWRHSVAGAAVSLGVKRSRESERRKWSQKAQPSDAER